MLNYWLFLVPVLPCFYVYSQYESHPSRGSRAVSALQITERSEAAERDELSRGEEVWEGEEYEHDRALSADRTYLKFKKRLDCYPEQCFRSLVLGLLCTRVGFIKHSYLWESIFICIIIALIVFLCADISVDSNVMFPLSRYCFKGKPLWASKDGAEAGVCPLCGGPRVYEMQLMPPLLYYLQQACKDLPSSSYSPNDWEWLTLIVFTCAQVESLLALLLFSSACKALLTFYFHRAARLPSLMPMEMVMERASLGLLSRRPAFFNTKPDFLRVLGFV